MIGVDQPRLFSPGRRTVGRTRRGADRTTRALRELGRLERVDEALVVALRAAADTVDAAERLLEHGETSPFAVAATVRTFLAATGALYARVGVVEPDAGEFWDALSAPVVDAPPP